MNEIIALILFTRPVTQHTILKSITSNCRGYLKYIVVFFIMFSAQNQSTSAATQILGSFSLHLRFHGSLAATTSLVTTYRSAVALVTCSFSRFQHIILSRGKIKYLIDKERCAISNSVTFHVKLKKLKNIWGFICFPSALF